MKMSRRPQFSAPLFCSQRYHVVWEDHHPVQRLKDTTDRVGHLALEAERGRECCELLWAALPLEINIGCLFVQVEIAVRNGYRHLDLAMVYQNQHEVGAALKKVIPYVVKREELFITSKLWNSGHQPNEVEKQLDETLAQLGIDYLDLYREWNSWNRGLGPYTLGTVYSRPLAHSFCFGKRTFPVAPVNCWTDRT